MVFKIGGGYGCPPQIITRPDGHFREGNQEALRVKLTPEAHNKRMQALFRGWGSKVKGFAGDTAMTKNQVRKAGKRKRKRLYETVAKEAREIQDLARRNAQAAMKRMAEIAANSPNETAAIAAATVLLDRAYGKASQTNINAHLDANGKTTDVSQKELDTRIEAALKRIDALTGGAGKAPPRQEQPADLRQLDRNPDSTTKH